MNHCEFEKYFIEYISGNLNDSEKLDFHEHLNTCTTCPRNLEKFYSLHQKLENRKRPEPDSNLLKNYHRSLSELFTDESQNYTLKNKISDFFNSLIPTQSPKIRFAEIVGLILCGIILGWFIFSPNNYPDNIESNSYEYFSKPINSTEIEYINYYFQAAELLFMELKNVNHTENNNIENIAFNKNIAQKLLIKTFIIHEIALRQNNPQILRLLSKIEILLYEISNLDDNTYQESFESFSLIIDETNLLNDIRKFQKQLIKYKNPDQKEKIKVDPFFGKEREENIK